MNGDALKEDINSGISFHDEELKSKDERIAELEREFERASSNYTFMYKQNQLLQSQVQLLEEALKKYTDDESWFVFKREHNGVKEYDTHHVPHMKHIAFEALQKLKAMRGKNV